MDTLFAADENHDTASDRTDSLSGVVDLMLVVGRCCARRPLQLGESTPLPFRRPHARPACTVRSAHPGCGVFHPALIERQAVSRASFDSVLDQGQGARPESVGQTTYVTDPQLLEGVSLHPGHESMIGGSPFARWFSPC